MEYTVTKMVTPQAIITIRRPILTEEERAKRMKLIHDAACNVIRSKYRIMEERERAEREKLAAPEAPPGAGKVSA